MTWNDVKSFIADSAPLLGGLLGGPAGTMAGTLISKALGVPNTPDAIVAELKNNPDALVKVKQIEADKEVELQRLYVTAEANRLAAETQRMQEETKQLQAVNETMRTEAKSEHWPQWLWRPFNGFILGIGTIEALSVLGYLAYRGIAEKDPSALGMIPALAMAFIGILGVPGAAVGIASWQRGRLKRVQAGEVFQPGMLDRILKR